MRFLRTGHRVSILRAPFSVPPAGPFVPDRFVSPTGSALNSGSSSAPWSVDYFNLGAGAVVQPGIKVGALGGDYVGQYVGGSAISGAPDLPVILRGMPGERATIDGHVESVGGTSIQAPIYRLDANYLWLWDLEIVNTDPLRQSNGIPDTSNPSDMNFRAFKSLRDNGHHNKVINSWIHDTANGVESQSQIVCFGSEYHGCKINNNGWWSFDRGHGHPFYVQNVDALGKLLKNCICYGAFDVCVQITGTDSAAILFVTSDGLILFNCGHDGTNYFPAKLLIQEGGTVTTAGNSAHRNDHIWGKDVGTPFDLNSLGNSPILPIEVTGCYVVGQPGFFENQGLNIQQTTFVQYQLGGRKAQVIARATGQPYNTHSCDNNDIYALDSDTPFVDYLNSVATQRNHADWVGTTAYDVHSTFTNALKPSVSRVFVQPNGYEAGRAHVACYDWAGIGTLPIDLSLAGLAPGDPYKIWHAYTDWYGTADYSGTYTGSPVNVSMTGWVPPDFIGMPGKHCDATGPEFAPFVIRKAA
jgi:hypothetical protein